MPAAHAGGGAGRGGRAGTGRGGAISAQVLDALVCSHGLGIAHRDLKPANIMVTDGGGRRNAMVLDFGLGVLAEEADRDTGTRLTAHGEYLGTPLYSAPEQLCGKPPTVLSDVYAWGLICIECLTGAPAIGGRTMAEVVHAQLSLQPVSLPRALAEHPLGRLLRTATAKEAANARPAARDLLAALQRIDLTSLPRREALAEVAAAGGGVSSVRPDGAWQVPLPRNPNFTGRRELLARLRDALATDPLPAVIALSGLGGIGKTQIALEYAYRHAHEYELVAWLRAEEGEALAADYAALAERLGLPERDTRDRGARIEAVRRWLERRRHWLLVFDNAPAPEAIRDYLPHWPTGHVIATSRHQLWRSVGVTLPVDVLQPEEAADFLVSRTGDRARPEAMHLGEELGWLPLALEEAAAYIEATGHSVATYRRLLESNRLRLFREGAPPADYPWTVRSTWELSLQRLEAEAPQAAQLLCLCAFLAPDDVPLADLRDGLVRLGDVGLAALGDPVAIDRGLAALRRYSLIKLEAGAVSLHRLVQLVTRDRLASSERARWAERALSLVEAIYPRSSLAGDGVPAAGRLLPHAMAALAHADGLPSCDLRAAQLLVRTGIYLSATGVQARGIEHLAAALRIVDRHPELGERERAGVLGNVAVVQNARGEVYEARDLFDRALAIHERLDGAESLPVGLDLVNLTWIRRVLGELDAAREAGERSVRILRGALGAWHPIVATAQSVTARVLGQLGELEASRTLIAEVFGVLDRARSKFHRMMAGAWFQAGVLALAMGDVARAAACARQGGAVGEPAYGADHPLVLSNLLVAGQTALEREEWAAAGRAFERVVDGSQRTCARPHADLALGLPLLAESQRRAGDAPGARRTVELAMATIGAVAGDRTQVLAEAHLVRGNLCADAGDLAAARREHEAACALLGNAHAAHPALLPALNALARTQVRAGALAEAEATTARGLAIAAAARFDRHLHVAAILEALAFALRGLGRHAEAAERLGQAEAIVADRLGEHSARARRLRVWTGEVGDA
ncbi:MAG: FxSxx-COOH system tetratricopeptide repeat protein [Candidatus Binatia bacterium]